MGIPEEIPIRPRNAIHAVIATHAWRAHIARGARRDGSKVNARRANRERSSRRATQGRKGSITRSTESGGSGVREKTKKRKPREVRAREEEAEAGNERGRKRAGG